MLQKHISQYSDEELQAWIQQLVDDKTPENMTIEYKSEEAFGEKFKLEIAKDISSFANTKGGVIIYGIPEESVHKETEKLAIPSSDYGTEPIPNFVSRLENILIDTISPHLPDIWIREVPILEKPNLRVYVVWHPESWLKPHMVEGYQELRYYRRGLRRTVRMTEIEVMLEVEKGEYKAIENLAHGQKCMVVLMVALAEGEFPLIVDQPEDALHAPGIEEGIVSTLRSRRGIRQCLFATRNANIIVSADAEQIFALRADAHKGELVSCGCLDNYDQKSLVIYHVEGGEEAFERRKTKYSLSPN